MTNTHICVKVLLTRNVFRLARAICLFYITTKYLLYVEFLSSNDVTQRDISFVNLVWFQIKLNEVFLTKLNRRCGWNICLPTRLSDNNWLIFHWSALRENGSLSACFKVLLEYMRFTLHIVVLILCIIEQWKFSFQLFTLNILSLKSYV